MGLFGFPKKKVGRMSDEERERNEIQALSENLQKVPDSDKLMAIVLQQHVTNLNLKKLLNGIEILVNQSLKRAHDEQD